MQEVLVAEGGLVRSDDCEVCNLGEKVIAFVKSLFFAMVHFKLVS